MTLEDRLASVLGKITTLPRVIQVRAQEEMHNGYHGNGEARAGLEALVLRLEAAAEKLEKAVA